MKIVYESDEEEQKALGMPAEEEEGPNKKRPTAPRTLPGKGSIAEQAQAVFNAARKRTIPARRLFLDENGTVEGQEGVKIPTLLDPFKK